MLEKEFPLRLCTLLSIYFTAVKNHLAAEGLVPCANSINTDTKFGGVTIDGMLHKMKVPSKQRAWGVLEKVAIQLSSATTNQDLPEIYKLYMDDDGTYPNNKNYPLLLYRSAFHGTQQEGLDTIVSSGEWTSPWVWGIFQYHHYHSTAWELLVCVAGEADVQIGGPKGPIVNVASGDVALIPPGLAHKQIRDSGGFTLLGCYPKEGCSGVVDTLRGAPTEEQRANIRACSTPERDPILGLNIASLWRQ